jgi:phage anti-repressor protein
MQGGFMQQIIKVQKNGVSAWDLYTFLEVESNFATWIKRRFTDYGFAEGKDFIPFLEQSTGGRPREDYILSIDTAKEIAIVEKTEKGREIRKYLIAVESAYRKQIERDSSKLTRRGFTDLIQDSGEQERMHGHAYSTYTKMIYKHLGIEYTKEKNFRDTLTAEQLKAVETLEHIAEGYLRLGFDYSQIKDALPKMIVDKQKEMQEALSE